MARKSKKSSSTITLPGMKGVEGKRATLPEGEYLVEVEEVTTEEGEKGEYFKWVFIVMEGKHEGAKLFYNTSLLPNALWNLRSLLESLGIDPPDEETEMDVDDFVGQRLNVMVDHEEYNGKQQARITDHWPVTDDQDEEKPAKKAKKRDDEEDEPKKSRRSRDKDEEADEQEEKGRSRRSKGKDNTRQRDDDEDDKPARGKKSKKQEKLSEDEINGMDEESLAEVIEQYKLDIDLEDFSTMRKKRAAVVGALEEADMIDA